MGAQSVLYPLMSADRAQELVTEDTYEEIRQAPSKGRLVAWAAPFPELLGAMDIAVVREGPYCHRVRRAGIASMFIEVAEAEGFSTDVCSYFKIMIGLALLLKRGQEQRIPEKFRVPPPDFVAYDSACPVRNQFGEVLRDIFHVPLLVLDYPFIYDPHHWQRDFKFVTEQLQDIVAFTEERTGRSFDWGALRQLYIHRRQANHMLRYLKGVPRHIPAPVDYTELLRCKGPFMSAQPSPRLEEYGQQIKAEVEDRMARGIASISHERHRLLWVGFPVWGEERTIAQMLAEKGAVVVSGHFGLMVYGDSAADEIPPDGIDLDRPLLTAGAAFPAIAMRPLSYKMRKWVQDYIEGYAVDGVIAFNQATCRTHSVLISQIAHEIEEGMGLPTLIINSDHCDPQYFSPAQMQDRLHAFIEALDSRKPLRRETNYSANRPTQYP